MGDVEAGEAGAVVAVGFGPGPTGAGEVGAGESFDVTVHLELAVGELGASAPFCDAAGFEVVE